MIIDYYTNMYSVLDDDNFVKLVNEGKFDLADKFICEHTISLEEKLKLQAILGRVFGYFLDDIFYKEVWRLIKYKNEHQKNDLSSILDEPWMMDEINIDNPEYCEPNLLNYDGSMKNLIIPNLDNRVSFKFIRNKLNDYDIGVCFVNGWCEVIYPNVCYNEFLDKLKELVAIDFTEFKT